MGWSEWPSWLKGGITISSLLLICYYGFLLLIILESSLFPGDDAIGLIIGIVFLLISFIFLFPAFVLGLDTGSQGAAIIGTEIFGVLISFIVWFLLGAIIGFIVGKMRGEER